ncbi:MAG: hypothetical protein EP339_10915 [Gammaproteobacteria bacterium]|uniref:PilZ domain-containing protein n=1 Tax=Marinobacter nitratireducens TaxID=1137280 RepID=A0A072NH05_9GAMM|nr:hypothetical protein [Marinobacter nitratireducens]KEF32410.1 hypothetical protein D777_01044 [Marinobacter nitratireducens]TNE74350.1 MAG: hypothetical protein EP339_10915 [Gammaproteobacteria bacterium]TNE98154.1 MAG: hypothetical protein EP328_05285 [Gammaproteobacteria bacterium]
MNEALPDLIARFRIRKSLFRKELVEAFLYELDAYGCVIKTDKVFEPGDTIVMDVVMDMPFDQIRAEGVSGLVTERRKHCSNFFYSIDFVEPDTGNRSPLAEKLRRIREVLSKKQSLKSRRSSGPVSGFRQMA